MNEEMMKSLVSLIDETIAEVDELKKSSRFEASEVKLGEDDSKIHGKDKNGSLGKEEDKDDDDKDKDEDKDMDKAEGKNSEADPNAGHHQVAKGDDEDDDDDDDDKKKMDKAEGKNSEADPNAGHHQVAKKDDCMPEGTMQKSGVDEDELKKSLANQEQLFKSYVDDRIAPINDNLKTMMEMIKEIADAPVTPKGATYKSVQPLQKNDESEPLSKSVVLSQLLELKKSGKQHVMTEDIVGAELANSSELAKIADKYNLK